MQGSRWLPWSEQIFTDVNDGAFERSRIDINEHYLRPLLREEKRGRRANAAGSAGYQADLAVHLLRHEGRPIGEDRP